MLGVGRYLVVVGDVAALVVDGVALLGHFVRKVLQRLQTAA